VEIRCGTQLSVYLENRVGALADLCVLIAQNSINLLAICAIDTIDEAVLRIVPEDEKRTKTILEDHGFKPIETEVLVIELSNRPGATGQVASSLSEAGVNIDYIYASAHPGHDKALLVRRTHQTREAISILSGK